MTPSFLGIGVPKSGTTSLHHYLQQHPDIGMARKESHFFLHADGRRRWCGPGDDASTQNEIYDWDEYLAAFPEAPVTGEFSPQYLADPDVPRRVRDRLPDVRLIAILRDPVERTYSNYLHLRRNRREPIGHFEDALAKEDERLAAGWEPFWGYKTQSRYGTNFGPWLDAFPKDRFLVLTLRDLRRAPQETMRRVHAFLGVDHHDPDYVVYNPGGVGRIDSLHQRLLRKTPFGGVTRYILPKRLRWRIHLAVRHLNSRYPPMRPETARRLREEFLPEVERVERWFRLDVPAWKPTEA